MNPIAIYYDTTIIYWSQILVAAAVIAGCFIAISMYSAKGKLVWGMMLYLPVSIVLSLICARIVCWYCYMENLGSFKDALTDFEAHNFLIPGILIGIVISAFIVKPLTKTASAILDSMAPAMSFIISIIYFSFIYSDKCRGKGIITNTAFQKLPFASKIITTSGTEEWRIASFFIAFIIMLLITVLTIIFTYANARITFAENISSDGHVFRAFLVLYSCMEIVIDSTRYDAAHLYFPGEALASLNKGASFMGLSQFVGALICIYVFVYYLIKSIKLNKIANKKHTLGIIIPSICFVLSVIGGGVTEYLVQRYSSRYVLWYSIQSTCVIIIAISIYCLFLTLQAKNQE